MTVWRLQLYDLKYVLCDGVVYLMIDIEHPREKRLSQLISCTAVNVSAVTSGRGTVYYENTEKLVG